jgi:hypothetical protein
MDERMSATLPLLTWAYVDSGSTTALTAAVDTGYVIDTATALVTVTLPTGTPAGHTVIIKNWPLGGPQFGGIVTGHNVTVQAGPGESIDQGTDTVNPPTTPQTAATHKLVSTGPAGWGAGTGWVVT